MLSHKSDIQHEIVPAITGAHVCTNTTYCGISALIKYFSTKQIGVWYSDTTYKPPTRTSVSRHAKALACRVFLTHLHLRQYIVSHDQLVCWRSTEFAIILASLFTCPPSFKPCRSSQTQPVLLKKYSTRCIGGRVKRQNVMLPQCRGYIRGVITLRPKLYAS